MSPCIRTNNKSRNDRAIRSQSVFLPCDNDEAGKYKPVPISSPPSYNPKVKIHDWQLRSPVESRDNKTGGFGKSTYKRLGMDDEPIGISTTREMTEQIHTKSNYDEEYRHRRMLNFYSFPYTETTEYKEALKLTDIILPKPIEPTDYRTTLRDDFPSHFPTMKSQKPTIPDVPWLLYRRILGYSNDDLVRRPGISKFLDDNMEIQNRAAALKMPRFVSYDLMKREYTDTERFSDAFLKKSVDFPG